MFDKLRCIAGFHDWTDWKTDPKNTCDQMRYCNRIDCDYYKKPITKEVHTWSEWDYVQTNLCDQARICNQHTHIQRRSNQHIWNKWEYKQEKSCIQIRSCIRCPEKAEKQPERDNHNWDIYRYEELTGNHIAFCRRCPEGKDIKQSDNNINKIIDTAINNETNTREQTLSQQEPINLKQNAINQLQPGEVLINAILYDNITSRLACLTNKRILCVTSTLGCTESFYFNNITSINQIYAGAIFIGYKDQNHETQLRLWNYQTGIKFHKDLVLLVQQHHKTPK